MNRRHFLALGILALGAGGVQFLRGRQARAALQRKLLEEALPLLANHSTSELLTQPVRAREEIKRYFHGKCLNVQRLVQDICSPPFRERISRYDTQEEREACFLQAFCERVVTEAEILNQIEIVAAEVGSELDAGWSRFCADLSVRWNAHLAPGGSRPLAPASLSSRLDHQIEVELGQAVQQAASQGQKVALGETVGKIGQSAVMLLPLVRFGKGGLALGVPLFVVLAARHVWDYVLAQWEDRQGADQAAISGRLALLGQRVGIEFEKEVRQRLIDLHSWQEHSVRTMTNSLVEERLGWWGGIS